MAKSTTLIEKLQPFNMLFSADPSKSYDPRMIYKIYYIFSPVAGI